MTKLPKAPQHEGVDPLTDGNSYHGEDIKGSSTLVGSQGAAKAEVRAEVRKSEKLTAEQKVAEKKADNAAEAEAKQSEGSK